MRYDVNVLPACVVLAHLAGIALTFPVLNDCPNDSPSLVKRDAEAHVSIPHVVANFDPQSAESPSLSKEETHTLQKRAEPMGARGKKVPWYKKGYNAITNLVCGTARTREQAAIDAMLRQSNAGISQQEVIAPEGSGEGVQGPVIDLGEDNQSDDQSQDELNTSMYTRPRAQTMIRRPNVGDINNQGMNYDQPVLRLNQDGSIQGTRGSRVPVLPDPRRIQDTERFQRLTSDVEPIMEMLGLEDSGILPQSQSAVDTVPQGSVQSGRGSVQEGTEVGDPDELRISLGESSRNPFVPGKAAREFYREDDLWGSDGLNLSDEVEADVVDVGPNVGNNQPLNGQDPMVAGKFPRFMKKMVMDYGVPYAVEKTLGVDITPYLEHPGVKDYLAGRTGRRVVVEEQPTQQEGFFRRLFNGRGREEAPLKVVTGPVQSIPGYTGEIDVQPGWVINPSEAIAQAYANLRQESDLLAQQGIGPPGYEEEAQVASNEEQRLLEEPNDDDNRRDPRNRAEVLPNQMDVAQIRSPVAGINAQAGSPSRSNVAEQDDNETDYVSFGDGDFLIGEDTANFAANLKDSVRSQGWNLGVSQIQGFPQVEVNQGPNVESPVDIQGEGREANEYTDLADRTASDVSRDVDDYADLANALAPEQDQIETSVRQQLNADDVDPNLMNFSFTGPNLANSLQLGGSGVLQGQESQQLTQAAQQLQ